MEIILIIAPAIICGFVGAFGATYRMLRHLEPQWLEFAAQEFARGFALGKEEGKLEVFQKLSEEE